MFQSYVLTRLVHLAFVYTHHRFADTTISAKFHT